MLTNVTSHMGGNFLTLAGYLGAQFTTMQSLELLLRALVAGICGACIGIERTRRLKEAGMRTHVIVCCTAALMMIVSKYGFADLTAEAGAAFNGTRGADPARIAAQVVSGVSFLGAGAIFKSGNTIKGLTTAAGIWATAGVGLAVGSGMYILGIGFTVMLIVLQILMHRFTIGSEMVSHQLSFTVEPEEGFRDSFDSYLEVLHAQIMESEMTYTETGLLSYKLLLKMPHGTIQKLDDFLQEHAKVRTVSYSNITT